MFEKFLKQKGLTFDDVLLLPGYSEVLPRNVSLKTQLTRNLKINIPLVSAAMDTVTRAPLAIAIALEGGLGIIHKNFSINDQVLEVEAVKRHQSDIVTKPFTLKPDQTVHEAREFQSKKGFSTFPIVDDSGIFLGLVTNRDLKLGTPGTLLKDVMVSISDLVVAYADENKTSEDYKKLLLENRLTKLPILKSKQEQVITGILFEKDVDNELNFPNALVNSKKRLMVGAAVGVTKDMMERIEALFATGVNVIAIDTAHGHSAGVLKSIKLAKETFRNVEIIGGNVATKAGALALIQAGVDAVKVGVGPGSICTTRIVAGVGVPQLTAIFEAYKACKEYGVPVIADGGIKYSGDIVKALAAGASTVMAGGIFAGTNESPGEIIIHDGKKFKSYRGMGSVEAMQEGSKDRYFQDVEDDIKKLVPEGIVGRVPLKGTVADIVYQYIGGVRAGMGYCGAATIAELHEKAQFIEITSAGITESHPHDVTITKEAPNYSRK
jgi:IMP dehydrogenase